MQPVSKRFFLPHALLTLSLLSVPSIYTHAQELLYVDGEDKVIVTKISQPTVVDGRLRFNDLEELNEFFNHHANDDEDALFQLLNDEYEQSFLSLRPPVTESNEDYVYNKLNTTYAGKTVWTADAINATEDIIGHDAFAALLNVDGEIQVGGDIYKYTDVGMFSVSKADYSKLTNHLDLNGVSKSLLSPTDSAKREQYLYAKQAVAKSAPVEDSGVTFWGAYPRCDWAKNECNEGDTPLDSEPILMEKESSLAKLSYSNELYESGGCETQEPGIYDEIIDVGAEDCNGGSGGGSGSGSGSGSGGTTTDPMDGLEAFVSNLQPCSPSSGIFGNIFGDNKVCIDRYESKKRVKTKAFNYDYFIVYHTGIKVKHQKKGWTGLWRKQDTTAMALGGRKIQFKYDVTAALAGALANLNFQESKITAKSLGQQWTLNNNFYTNPYGYSGVTSTVTYSNNLYPIVFQDDLTIETHGDNAILDWLIAQGEKQATSEKLNEYFWGNLRNGVKSAVQSITFNSSYQPPMNTTLAYKNAEFGKIYVQKSYFRHCINCKKIQKTLDFGFLLSLNMNPENNWSISGGVETSHIYKPKDYSVTVYGVAKRNGVWHGSLIDF